MSEAHVTKRETPPGWWVPRMCYAVHGVLWRITGLWAGAWELRWLAVLSLHALGLSMLPVCFCGIATHVAAQATDCNSTAAIDTAISHWKH
jgi:hypothetical protein